ncbi:uncharacterized protein [Nicotiana tomentosiformis]|uniref:uncharacterized protein n=1 Tax=Nicotiana tomentosiformis TaxID=4098 RepID=UPI00388CD8EC
MDEEEELSLSDGNLVPRKRRSVDVSNRVARAVDSMIDDFVIHEMVTKILEDDAEMASEVLISAEAVEGVSFPFAAIRAEGSATVASDILWQEEPSTSQLANDASSPADERGKGVVEDGYEMGSDLDAAEIRMMEEGFTQLEALQDELKEKDDELVRVIEKCSVLEETLRNKEEELEVSRAMEAQCGNFQTQVVELRRQLEECHLQMEVLHGEITDKQNELERAESTQSAASRKVEALEVVMRTLRSERESDLETTSLKKERLDERIGELERDNSLLQDQVATLEAEKTQMLAQTSSSHTSNFPNLDVFQDLHVAGSVPVATLEDARVKAREAQIACGYDPATPEAGEWDEDLVASS